jgi:hypothetical protein
MDPITAALTLATKLCEIHLAVLQAMPPETRAEYAKAIVADMTAWREFWQGLIPKQH